MVQKELFTPSDLAARWSVSVHTLAAWRQSGKGPKFTKLGGVRYHINDILEYEEKKKDEKKS